MELGAGEARLVLPTSTVRLSFLEAITEFMDEGRFSADDDSMLTREHRTFADTWSGDTGFAAYVQSLLDDAVPDAPRASHLVPSTTLWWVEGDRYIGRLSIRHRLTERLLDIGGHIGYEVRPSARQCGHATAMLREALPYARALAIDPALLTCDTGNIASRRVIETNGGVLEDERHGKLRYWVPTSG